MTVNLAKFEESTEIVIDTEVEAPAAGWAVNYASVNRIGALVAVHIEATNNAGAAGLVTTLQADFAPGDLVTTPDGLFTIGADGTVHFTGSTVADVKHICQAVFAAGQSSP